VSRSKKSEARQAAVQKMRAEAKAAERRRSLLIMGSVVLVALLIIGVAGYEFARQKGAETGDLALVGAPASSAGCQPIVTKPASGNNQHLPEGQAITYPDAPPAFGAHWPVWAPMSRKLYTTEDRPDVEYLVHNLEHGFTILWYDQTIADDDAAMADLRAMAKHFPSNTDLNDKFLVAPWLSSDGAPFPEGTHIALTHWSMGGTHGNPDEQTGVWEYCAKPSGSVVESFMADYPYSDSPEPNAM
jgi:hypothetical protein